MELQYAGNTDVCRSDQTISPAYYIRSKTIKTAEFEVAKWVIV